MLSRDSEQGGGRRADPLPQPTPPTASWRIRLLGRLDVEHEGRQIVRFRAQRYGVLLAYLALRARQTHGRDELIELLWPEADRDAGRTRLRQALASLRRQMEPPGTPPGSVLLTSGHSSVQLNPATVRTDVADFEGHLRAADTTASGEEQAAHLQAALDLYAGLLLPGFWDEWIVAERERIGALYVEALRRLAALREGAGDLVAALDLLRRASLADPNHLLARADLMRLLAARGRGEEALRQFDAILRLSEEEFGEEAIPAEIRALAEELRRRQRSRCPAKREKPPEAGADPANLPPNSRPAVAGQGRLLPRLPVPLAPFFGRETETAEILGLLGDRWRGARLVTLTGPGGSGKTRLALHVARQWDETHGGGEKDRSSSPVCVFVPLVDVSAPDVLPRAVADALRLERAPGREPTEQIVEMLSRRPPSLLVLDNFETLLGAGMDEPAGAALWVVTLLQSLPSLACLVTSRQRLLVDGEREFSVPPLPVPPPHPEGPDPAGLLAVPSVALFVDRARQARPDFQITPRNARTVAELCARLEGIPLAIEIAATWANTLSVSAMLARLEEAGRFSLLTSRRRDLPPRHRTLHAAIEGTVRALPPDLQTFFARLSVFRGGFSAQTCAAVCSAPLGWVDEALAHLREHSLIVPAACPASHSDPDEASLRFTLLETLREFGAEYLEATLGAGEVAALRERHARHFLALAERAWPGLAWSEQALWVRRLGAEHGNLRAALDWAELGKDGPEAALRLAAALFDFWHITLSHSEGRDRLEAALALPGAEEPTEARARALGAFAALSGGYRLDVVEACHQESLAIFRQLDGEDPGVRAGIAGQMRALGDIARHRGDLPRARALIEEALALCPREYPGSVFWFLTSLAEVEQIQGDEEAARTHRDEALALARAGNYHFGLSYYLIGMVERALWNGENERARALLAEAILAARASGGVSGLGHVLNLAADLARREGEYDRARALLEESLEISRTVGNTHGIFSSLRDLASLALAWGDDTGARSLFEQAVAVAQRAPDDYDWALTMVGEIARQTGELERAAAIYEQALAQFRDQGKPRGTAVVLHSLGHTELRQGLVPSARPRFVESLLLSEAVGDGVNAALCVAGLGAVEGAAGRPERGARLLGAAAARLRDRATRLDEVDRAELERAEAAAVAALGRDAFDAAFTEGQAMTWEQVIALVHDA